MTLLWFSVGLMSGFNLAFLVYLRIARADRRTNELRYDRYIAAHKARLAELEENSERRYVELRKKLGLPPREQEWS